MYTATVNAARADKQREQDCIRSVTQRLVIKPAYPTRADPLAILPAVIFALVLAGRHFLARHEHAHPSELLVQ
jgi:hypothetical protein